MKITYVVLIFLILISMNIADAKALSEQEKIEYLIKEVETVDAKFIRNGLEYSPKRAGDHIRYKLKYAGDEVKTAEDFIEQICSRSYLTNTPYYIKFSDGNTTTSQEWLIQKLSDLERLPSELDISRK